MRTVSAATRGRDGPEAELRDRPLAEGEPVADDELAVRGGEAVRQAGIVAFDGLLDDFPRFPRRQVDRLDPIVFAVRDQRRGTSNVSRSAVDPGFPDGLDALGRALETALHDQSRTDRGGLARPRRAIGPIARGHAARRTVRRPLFVKTGRYPAM